MNTAEDLTLILGATGTTGSRVARRLAAGGARTRLGASSATPSFDWSDESTWPSVLEGVSSAHLVYHPDLVAPGAVETVRRFAQLAATLTEEGHSGELYEVTGPRPLTFAEILSTVLDGRSEYLSDGVERALRRSSRDFTEYTRDAAATGIWES